MSKVYAQADKSLKRLYTLAANELQNLATTAKWDEINVIRTVQTVYRRINEQALEEYEKIARVAYKEALPDDQRKDRILDILFVMALLERYDPKTEYRYDREWERKADRLAESILSVEEAVVNDNTVRQALKRALNLMNGQLRNMADTITDEARIQAFEDAGIPAVRWNTQHDNKVCGDCEERDGHIFPLYAIPTKHRRCRCWMSPAKMEET